MTCFHVHAEWLSTYELVCRDCLAVGIVTWCMPVPGAEPAKKRKSSLLEDTQRQRDDAVAQVRELRVKYDALGDDRDAIIMERDELRERLAQADAALAKAQLEEFVMRTERDKLKQELARVRDDNERLRLALNDWHAANRRSELAKLNSDSGAKDAVNQKPASSTCEACGGEGFQACGRCHCEECDGDGLVIADETKSFLAYDECEACDGWGICCVCGECSSDDGCCHCPDCKGTGKSEVKP